jgi:hypothetical protein
VEPGRRDERDEAAEQGERVDGDGAVTQRLLQSDAHKPHRDRVGAARWPAAGGGCTSAALVVLARRRLGAGGGAQAEAGFAHRKRHFKNGPGARILGIVRSAG